MANPDARPGGGATPANVGGFVQVYEGTTIIPTDVDGKGVVDKEVPVKAFEGTILGTKITVVSGELPSGVEGATAAAGLAARHIAVRLGLGGGEVVAEVKRTDI